MKKCKISRRLMGSDFELIVCGPDEARLKIWLAEGIAEIERLEYLLTEFGNTSDTAAINTHAGISAIPVDDEVAALIERCIQLSKLTQGAFDITSGALKKLYSFDQDSTVWPSPALLQQTLALTGYRHIVVSGKNKVFLPHKGMRIGFGAIGKGYAADRVRKLWTGMGVTSGVVNASGDLTAWGTQPDGTPWKVGIADPDRPEDILMWLPLDQASVATSGNYEQFIDRNGIRYSHNIDPVTGLPARFLKSVTVVSPSAELSDALATAVTIMGVQVGMDFINQLPQVHCVIIDERNKIFTSEKIKSYVPEQTQL